VFALLATANGAGYRYGVSDQAFYIPAVTRALEPAAFPRDGFLIDAQARLMLVDELLAAAARATALPLDRLFFGAYLLTLALLWTALVLVGTRLYSSAWMVAAMGAALTLRHHIPGTSANSLEPYFHPRMLAFGIGVLAIAALLRRQGWLAVPLLAIGAVIHMTTALWFAILIGVALAVLSARFRRFAVGAGVIGLGSGAWAVTAGPLRESLTTMDAVWLQAVAGKDSLFASQWPMWVWAVNLGSLAALWWAHRRRLARGSATPEDTALVWGATALVMVFLVTLPLVEMGLALPVQLQISRVFWLVDLLATLYLLSLLDWNRRDTRVPVAVAIVLIAVSAGRGAYIMLVERPERNLASIALADTPWHDAMRWVSSQPLDTHVLADPGHAWRHGTSVRVSAGRDVVQEDVKDAAIAIYSRPVASRVVERGAALGDFGALTVERALELKARYDVDLLVTEADMPLPLAYRNRQFRIYNLK